MAAIMQCPSCKKFLAEEGDMDKGNAKKERNFYRVYDSVGNLLNDGRKYRALYCLCCKYFADINQWGV